MSTYNLLLFGHITFVVIWLGSITCMQVLAMRALSAGRSRAVEFLADVEWIGWRVQGPAAMLVLAFGVLLAIEGQFDVTQVWILLGFAAFLLAGLVTVAYLGPQTGQISALVHKLGHEHKQVRARTRQVLLVSRIELVILFAVVLTMVAKPGA